MNVYYIMSITEKPKHAFSAIVMAVYFLIDKIIPYLVKITFPFWALPFISFTIAWKFIRLWKNIISFLLSLLNPDTPPTLAYAILKGNGQYLRKHSQDVLVHQFYDYTSRKFMNIIELEPEFKVVQLQCNNCQGLTHLAEAVNSVKGLSSSKSSTRNSQNTIVIQETDYSIEGNCQNIDCFLLFNFKSKINYLRNQKIDLLKLINYCRYHLSKEGYLVFGDYFEKGEKDTFKMLFESFGLKITEEEDITKNIEYAKKLMVIDRHECQAILFKYLKRMLSKVWRRKPYDLGKQFHVLVMEKNQE